MMENERAVPAVPKGRDEHGQKNVSSDRVPKDATQMSREESNTAEARVGACAPQGFRAAAVAAGIKEDGALDVCVLASDQLGTAAAVFTTNRVQAAPVQVSQLHLTSPFARAVVVTSGNANAATGPAGRALAVEVCETVAQDLDCASHDVLLAQTGLIGVPLDAVLVCEGAREAARILSPANGTAAAKAMMTTDTKPKTAVAEFSVDGVPVLLGGMTKGAGMIAPEMATMLCVLTTDAAVAPAVLREALQGAVAETFNMISIEGDMSTNDTVFLLANGASGAREISSTAHPAYPLLCQALREVCAKLAQAMIRDGEGASKFVTVCVEGAATLKDARLAARHVVGSILVKCSWAGEDPYWGRVLSAMGASGAHFEAERVAISYGGVQVCAEGRAMEHDADRVATHMKGAEIEILAVLGDGPYGAIAWGCDLTREFVAINVETS